MIYLTELNRDRHSENQERVLRSRFAAGSSDRKACPAEREARGKQEEQMRKACDTYRAIWIAIYLLLAIMLGIILIASITEPQHNLFGWQMAVGTVLGAFALIVVFCLWQRYIPQRVAGNAGIYYGLLILYGMSLYGVSCLGRNMPDSLGDYGQVWTGAAELAGGEGLSQEWYFKIYSNNIKPMLFLSVLFRLSSAMGMKDPFYFVLIFSVLEVVGAAWSAGVLVGDSPEESRRYRIPVLLLFVFLLPIWANTQAFYTDSMSFCIGIMALAGIKLALRTESRGRRLLLLGGTGLLVALGFAIKVTIVIPLIAGFLVLLFCGRIRELLRGKIWIFLLFAAIGSVLSNWWAGSYEITQIAKETSEPVIDWIALGMKGDGSWEGNKEFVLYALQLPTKADKIEYTKAYIWENRREFVNPEHLLQKLRCNFASGSLGAWNYSYYQLKPGNLLYELFSPWGKHFWRSSQFCFCYLFANYLLIFLGAVVSVVFLFQKKGVPVMKKITDLTLLGNIIFLMIWEANNRLLYNQAPMILLCGVLSVRMVLAYLQAAKSN